MKTFLHGLTAAVVLLAMEISGPVPSQPPDSPQQFNQASGCSVPPCS